MEVEVDLYSGRPNPRFSLLPQPAAELRRRIGSLQPLAVQTNVAEGLGYRGFRIQPDQDDQLEEVIVSGGVVRIREGSGSERLLADTGRSLERWLAELGADRLDPEVVAAVREHLGPG
jgi:hypothetical protein